MIVIGSHGGEYISIDPIISGQGDDWLQANVNIVVNGFEGNITVYLETSDLLVFQGEILNLHNNLKGTATLNPIEGQLCFTLKGDGLGHIEVTGSAYTHARYGSHLEFEFETDQTLLPKIANAIKEFTSAKAQST